LKKLYFGSIITVEIFNFNSTSVVKIPYFDFKSFARQSSYYFLLGSAVCMSHLSLYN